MAETEKEDTSMFSLTKVTSKPTRKYRKGSKYDPLLEAFLKESHTLVEVTVQDKTANYMRTQLAKRIDANKKFSKIEASVVNDKLYLEKK